MSLTAVRFLLFVSPPLAFVLVGLGAATIRTNPLGGFLILVGSGYNLGLGIVYCLRKQEFWHPTTNERVIYQEKGDLSYWLIIPGMLITFFVSPIEYLAFPYFFPLSILLKITGLTIEVLGIIFFIWARKVLGSSYSGHISVKIDQQLVQNGPYRYIRHPAYLGFLLMALGISLGYFSLIGLVSIPTLLLPGLIYRIKVEDQMLASHFGTQFQQYAARTARMFPWIW